MFQYVIQILLIRFSTTYLLMNYVGIKGNEVCKFQKSHSKYPMQVYALQSPVYVFTLVSRLICFVCQDLQVVVLRRSETNTRVVVAFRENIVYKHRVDVSCAELHQVKWGTCGGVAVIQSLNTTLPHQIPVHVEFSDQTVSVSCVSLPVQLRYFFRHFWYIDVFSWFLAAFRLIIVLNSGLTQMADNGECQPTNLQQQACNSVTVFISIIVFSIS